MSTIISPAMFFPPRPWDLAQAVTCAGLCNTAYDMYAQWQAQGRPGKEADFRWEPRWTWTGPMQHGAPIWANDKVWIFNHRSPFAFLSWRSGDGVAYLAFRGTEDASDWLEDARAGEKADCKFGAPGRVHAGFQALYGTLRAALLGQVRERADQIDTLYVTGHSLGCGLSTVAVPDIIASTPCQPGAKQIFHFNLASPRVGDPVFTQFYDALGVPTYRVVNTEDVVPQVPTAVLGRELFEHVGAQVSFTVNYGSLGGNHSALNSYSYALQHPEQPAGPGAR